MFKLADTVQMFSILNEIKDNSPASIVGVVGTSIGGAASMYILVAITGYLTFGNDVAGNIVSQCTFQTVLRCLSVAFRV
jgi:amino acid permease